MKNVRSSPTAFRFDPTVKYALALIADRDGRSMANMMEWLIRQHCEREGLGWPPAIDTPQIYGTAKAGPAKKRTVKATPKQTIKKQGK